MSDIELGRKAIRITIAAISSAMQVAALIYLPWYISILLTLLLIIITMCVSICVTLMVSDESCAALGAKIGGAAARISNLFTRRSIA